MFPTVEKCKKHTLYHCHLKNTNTYLNNITTGKKDRRTIQGRGTPQENEIIYHGRITYNTEINKWTCNTCGKKYDPQSQQNAIQHACKHFATTKKQNTTKWRQKTHEVEKIYQTRKDTIWEINTTKNTNIIINPTRKDAKQNQNNQEQAQFWETINYIKQKDDKQWQCAEKNCGKIYTSIPPLLRHIAKNTQQNTYTQIRT